MIRLVGDGKTWSRGRCTSGLVSTEPACKPAKSKTREEGLLIRAGCECSVTRMNWVMR